LLHPSFAIIILFLFILRTGDPFVSELSSIYSSFGSEFISFLPFNNCFFAERTLSSQPNWHVPSHYQEMYSEVPSLGHEAHIFLSHSFFGLIVTFSVRLFWRKSDLTFRTISRSSGPGCCIQPSMTPSCISIVSL
jgi:hypothetical protein